MKEGVKAAKYAEDLLKSEIQVTRNERVGVKAASGGGWAAIFLPLPPNKTLANIRPVVLNNGGYGSMARVRIFVVT